MAKYTVSDYPRDNLTSKTRAILDALAANPATRNIGVRSGYRSKAHNAKAGGAKRSQHTHGNAIDLDIGGLSPAQKKEVLDTATKAGAKGIGIYSSGTSLHVDPRATPTVWGPSPRGKYRGLTQKEWGLIPDWARPTLDAVFGGFNPKQNPNLPEYMAPPSTVTRAQAVAPAVMPTRPVSMTPVMALNKIAPPSRLAPVTVGKVTRAPLDAIPASLTPAPVGKVERAPLGPVGQFSTPAKSLAHPVSAPKPSNLAAAPVGQVTRGPALAPAGPSTQKQIDAYSEYGQSRAVADETARLAEQYAQYQKMPGAVPAAKPLQHPISIPAPPPAPPAAILAPALTPPTVVKDYNVAEVQAAQAPRTTAYDVYSGMAESALDNTGQNTVSRDAFGNTSVTNKYGVTTGMNAQGYQTAVGSMPSMPGISGPMKGALPGLAGSMLGGYFGGPVGAIAGGLLGKAFAPGGALSGIRNIDTSQIPGMGATTAFARPDRSLNQFPGAPSSPSGARNQRGFDSRADRDHARGISPAAARDIDRGKTGLY